MSYRDRKFYSVSEWELDSFSTFPAEAICFGALAGVGLSTLMSSVLLNSYLGSDARVTALGVAMLLAGVIGGFARWRGERSKVKRIMSQHHFYADEDGSPEAPPSGEG